MRKTICLIVCFLCVSLLAKAQQTNEQMAAYYFDRGEFVQAAQLYETLYRQTDNVYYYQRLLSAYAELGRNKEAFKLVERRRKQHPRDLYLYVDEGILHKRQRQDKKADKCFDKAIELITGDLQPIPDLAQAFVTAGMPMQAARVYLAARAKTNNTFLYFNELVGVYQQAQNFQAMIGEYFSLLDHQPGMLQNVQVSMQKALADAIDRRLSDGIRSTLVSRLRARPDNRVYLEMMIWFSLQERDFAFALEQAQAIDRRFPAEGSEQVLRVARIARQNDALDVAESAFSYLLRKGPSFPYYADCRAGELEVAFAQMKQEGMPGRKEIGSLLTRYSSALEEFGKSERTVPLMRQLADLSAYYAADVQAAVDLLDDVLAIPRLKPRVRDEVKLELGDLLLFASQPWDASLLYMQVEKANKNDVLGATAKFKNAKLSYYSHEFKWASSQLNVLRASTSKLIANDAMELSMLISDNMENDSTYGVLEVFATADLLMYRNLLDSAWSLFDQVERMTLSHPILDDVLMRKAQIRVRQGRYADADSLFQTLVDQFPNGLMADDALMERAKLNEEKLGNKSEASRCYEKLLLDYPSSFHVENARINYNKLITK